MVLARGVPRIHKEGTMRSPTVVHRLLLAGMLLALLTSPGQLSASAADSASLPLADFNRDNFADLAIGVPYDSPGSVASAGAVDVIYGSHSGLSPTGVQYWHQDRPGTEGSAEEHDLFGQALAAGDFDGDGYFDLAVGVPEQTVGGHANAGAVHILYGSRPGLSTAGDQIWHQDSGAVGSIAEEGDYFGWTLAAGDFNGDGRDDLAVGVPFEDWTERDSGLVQILYGSVAGVTDDRNQLWRQGVGGLLETEEFTDQFGKALAVGDFNDDGYADLVVGVPDENFTSPVRTSAGVVQVIHGSALGLAAAGNQVWHQDRIDTQGSADSEELFGIALTTGDFNGDGRDDLAVGVPGEEVGSHSRAGAVQVFFSMAGGLTHVDLLLDQDDLGINAHQSDFFGRSLSASDFNGDGYADLAVGVPGEDLLGVAPQDCGSVNVLYGSGTGPSTTDFDVWYQGIISGLTDTPEAYDQFGRTLAAGDFNGDGYGDLIIGVPYEDVVYQSDTKVDAGYVHILYGTGGGLSNVRTGWLLQDNFRVLDAPADNELFGKALAAIPGVYHRSFLPIAFSAP